MNFEILVMGDGAYVHAVLNAVSGIRGYGVLGALGMTLGLLIAAVKGIGSSQGPRLDFSWMLVSMVMFWIIFVPRVDKVIVSEVMVQPGNMAPRTFVVDNVPAGLAAVGWFTSTLTSRATMLYETAFGSATDEMRGTTGGLGRNLAILTQLRSLVANPAFTDPPTNTAGHGVISLYRANMGAFAQNCVFPLIAAGELSANQVMQSPGVSGVLNDITAHGVRTMRWLDESGVSTKTCRDAKELLVKRTEDGSLEAAFDRAAAARGLPISSREVVAAMGTYVNMNGQSMQEMTATLIMNSVLARSQVAGALSPADAQAVIMIEEAASRRSVQWAAEENLFIRMLRPMMGFFEGLFYALAPIMAFVITLGPFGWSMVGKYLMLPLWVALWFPMLAITQLYSNVQMEYFFSKLGSAANPYSPAQLIEISNQAMESLGAASALAAATPALAMSILMGGAVTMTALANRLNSGDVVDETKLTPEVGKVGPMAQQTAAIEGSMGGGQAIRGGRSMTFSNSEMMSSTQSLTQQAALEASQNFGKTMSQTLGESHRFSLDGSSGVGVTAGTNVSSVFDQSIREGQQVDAKTAEAFKVLRANRESLDLGGGTGDAMPVVQGKLGFNNTAEEAKVKEAGRVWAEHVAKNQGLKSDFAVAMAKDVRDSVTTSGGHGLSAESKTALSRAATDVIRSGEAYASVSALQGTRAVQEQTNPNVFVTQPGAPEKIAEWRSRLFEMGMSHDAYEQLVMQAGNGTDLATPQAREMAAILGAVHGGAVPGNAAGVAELSADISRELLTTPGTVQAFDHTKAAAINSGAPMFGGVQSEAAGVAGPSTTFQAIREQAAGVIDRAQGAIDTTTTTIEGSDTARTAHEMGVTRADTALSAQDSHFTEQAQDLNQVHGQHVDDVKGESQVSRATRAMGAVRDTVVAVNDTVGNPAEFGATVGLALSGDEASQDALKQSAERIARSTGLLD